MVESFLKYLQYQKRLSPNTILAYENDLVQFKEFASGVFQDEDIAHASFQLIRAWIVALVESEKEAASVNRKIACLRSFYKYLLRNEVIKKDPMQKVRVLKSKKKLPSFVKQTEMSALLDSDQFDHTFEGQRNRLIIELFYGTGIRLSELITLKESQLDLHNLTIKVLGKRNKERVIPFSENLVSIIKNYTSIRDQEVVKAEHGCLLVTNEGMPCYPMMIYRIVKTYLTKYASTEKKSPHVLRHTYATHLLDKGAEINAVKDLLGHTSLAATQVYTHNSMEKLKKVFEKAHPKA